jgi:hypothetical protein
MALSLGVKLPGREADHSPPSSTEVKECMDLYLHSPNPPSWRSAQVKHRGNFTFLWVCVCWACDVVISCSSLVLPTFTNRPSGVRVTDADYLQVFSNSDGKILCSWQVVHLQCCTVLYLRVVTGEKNSPTVAHACRKRRLKWVLPQVGGWSTVLATLSL